jgi:hypothetical protein
MGRLYAVAAVVSLLLLAAACGNAATSDRRPAAEPVEHAVVPGGYRQRAVREAGISLALPRGWQVLAQRDAVYPGTIQILTRLNRGFRPYLAALGDPESPLKLFAFDRSFWHDRPTTAMVVRATYGRPAPYARWTRRMLRGIASLPNREGAIDAVRIDLPAGPALRASYRTTAGLTYVQYFVAARDGIWAVAFSTPNSQARRYAAAFATSARTLELKEPLGGPFRRPAPPPSS